jgi:sulfhydrogenase subunit beta (sulfur reductase)
MTRISIPKQEWDERLTKLLSSCTIYAPVENDFSLDYLKLVPEIIRGIVYNRPQPVTPLKSFFLPVRENITLDTQPPKPVVVIGAPGCDVMALAFLDQIYLDEDYPDPAYRHRRDNTIIIATDCLSTLENCHCTSYGIDPVGNQYADLSLAVVDDQVILSIYGSKGKKFIDELGLDNPAEPEPSLLKSLEVKRKQVVEHLGTANRRLPDFETTGRLVSAAGNGTWKKHAATCVSCGACSAICPTCSCFLLIDRPHFEKVRQLDTCQYPGFERVAGGEDSLSELSERFRNRYLCKYVWKPEKYKLKACTGCGRCINACIGGINKNKFFLEISN